VVVSGPPPSTTDFSQITPVGERVTLLCCTWQVPESNFGPGGILSRLRCSVAFRFPFKQISGPSGIRRRLSPSSSSPLHHLVASCLLTLYSISNVIKCTIRKHIAFQTPCSCPKFGPRLNIKLLLRDRCQGTEYASISKNECVKLSYLVRAINEYGAMVN